MMDFIAASPRLSEANLARLLTCRASTTIAGNSSLQLGAEDGAWLVTHGRVDVFIVTETEDTVGSRRYLTTFCPGELLLCSQFSPPLQQKGDIGAQQRVLMAVSHPGSQLVPIDIVSSCRRDVDPSNSELIQQAIAAWARRLQGVLPRAPIPTSGTPVHAGEHVQLAVEGPAAVITEDLLWVRQLTGSSLLFGHDELVIREIDEPIPLCAGSWLAGASLGSLAVSSTAQAIEDGWFWQGIAGLYEIVLRYAANEMTAYEESERSKLRLRLALDRSVFADAQSQLAEVLSNSRRDSPSLAFARPNSSVRVDAGGISPGDDRVLDTVRQQSKSLHEPETTSEHPPVMTPDPLFHACSLIAKRLGVTLRFPAESLQTLDSLETLQRLCDSSHLHSRKVLLRGKWWRCDHGPLLAYIEEEPENASNSQDRLRPVALLPSAANGYRLFDPVAQTVVAIDAKRAKSIATEAFMLYPAGAKPLSKPRDLVGPALRRHRHDLSMIFFMALAGGLLATIVPVVTGIIYGRVIPNGYRSELAQLALALVAVTIGACAFQVTRALSVLRLTAKLDLDLQPLVWGRLLALPVSFFRRFRVGDLADRVQGIGTIRQLLLADVTTTALALVISISSFFLLFYYSWQLALLASALLAALTTVTFFLSRRQLKHRRRSHEIQGKLSSLAFSLVQGISKLRSSGAEALSYGVWAGHFSDQSRHRLAAQRAAAVQASLNAFYLVAAELSLFALMGFGLRHQLRLSNFLAFSAAFGQVQAALLTFITLIPELLAIFPIYERLQPIFIEPAESDDRKRTVELHGDVKVCNVSYRYHKAGPLALENVSFHARAGEFIAIVGPSGSGKSTLVRLLLGFDQPCQGSIRYDDTDLASLDVKSVRRRIGTVLQNCKPICGDIFTNIVGGTSNNLQDAWEAARIAGIDQEIKAMPMGMHTIIGEGATTFSGGERQRLMIARAVVNRPRIVLLDEATSALDNPTQDKVQQCLEQMTATRIVVAHRLSTIRHADRIYVLERGNIVEEGTYQDLLGRCGYFAEMARRQIG